MKKLTDRQRGWLENRARNESKRHAIKSLRPKRFKKPEGHWVLSWGPEGSEDVWSIERPTKPPSRLCFHENAKETLEFFSAFRSGRRRRRGLKAGVDPWHRPKTNPRGPRKIRSYFDFAKLEHLSTAAAVVMAAEYQRIAEISGHPPSTIDLHRWSDAVFAKLFELDFFAEVGIVQTSQMYRERDAKRTMRIVSGTDALQLEAVAKHLQHLVHFASRGSNVFDDRIELICTALSEAMSNVAKHAYPEHHHFDYMHVNRWWVTAEADQVTGKLTLVIYDQGATIPVTLPTQTFWERVRPFLSADAGTSAIAYEDDASYIKGSLRYGATSTGQKHRGKGLAEMKGLIDELKGGHISIFSRGGRYHYDYPSAENLASFNSSIGGTLIEWEIDVIGGSGGQ